MPKRGLSFIAAQPAEEARRVNAYRISCARQALLRVFKGGRYA